jgi:hypothetical protein
MWQFNLLGITTLLGRGAPIRDDAAVHWAEAAAIVVARMPHSDIPELSHCKLLECSVTSVPTLYQRIGSSYSEMNPPKERL